MNISTKKKKYLQICRILDEIEKRYNFCNIHIVNGETTCNGVFSRRDKLCCNECHNLTKNGCGVKSISCKMSYCYIDAGPIYCGLVKTKKQDIAADRRRKLARLIREYVKKHDIPMYQLRASMSAQFKIQKILNKGTKFDEIEYDRYKARFVNK